MEKFVILEAYAKMTLAMAARDWRPATVSDRNTYGDNVSEYAMIRHEGQGVWYRSIADDVLLVVFFKDAYNTHDGGEQRWLINYEEEHN